jgi:hypothetical protein
MSNLYRGVHGASQGSELSRRDEIARTKDEQISPFMQVFVLEVISDPQQITTEKIEYWRNVLDISLSPSSNFDDGEEREKMMEQPA